MTIEDAPSECRFFSLALQQMHLRLGGIFIAHELILLYLLAY